MRLVRVLVVLALAAVVALVGLAVLAHGQPSQGSVYDTDARGPKVILDDGPHLERAPRFRLLVGTSRKSARWVEVNAVQYAGCDAGDRWNGQLCAKAAFDLGSIRPSGRAIALSLIGAAMAVTPLAAGLTTSRHRD